MDVALIRPEYEIFLRKASALLPGTLFLQNSRTDPLFPQLYSKLRRNGTSYVEQRMAHLPIHHGIFIDIFPLDGLPENRLKAWWVNQQVRMAKLKLLCAYGAGGNWKEQMIRRTGRMLGWHRHMQRTIQRAEKVISAYDPRTAACWCCYGNWRVSRDCVPKEQYGNGEPALFEGLPVRIPSCSNDYLTRCYGDWQADLPVHEQHGRAAAIDLHSDRLWRQP